jgi:hypothetical protein
MEADAKPPVQVIAHDRDTTVKGHLGEKRLCPDFQHAKH